MNFTTAAVASVPTETNLLLGVHLGSSTTQENGNTHEKKDQSDRQKQPEAERRTDASI